MDFNYIVTAVILTLHLSQVYTKSKSKKHHFAESEEDEESIENLLYYKDCQHTSTTEKPTVTTTEAKPVPRVLSAPLEQAPFCRYPKMCCALTCGNDCENNQQRPIERNFPGNFANNYGDYPGFESGPPMYPQSGMEPILTDPRAHMARIMEKRKKKTKPPKSIMPPAVPGRRNMGLAKEKIKKIISTDEEVKKVLKELLKITMQKANIFDEVSTTTENVVNLDYEYEIS